VYCPGFFGFFFQLKSFVECPLKAEAYVKLLIEARHLGV